MAEWVTPITDRTADDVSNAVNNQANETDNKGAINYNDLNRIENNFKYLLDRLNAEGYYIDHKFRNYAETEAVVDGNNNVSNVTQIYTEWFEQNIPWKSEIDRIRDNINNLLAKYLQGKNYTNILKTQYLDYKEANKLEDIELVTDETITEMKKQYRLCNTFKCGEGR